VLPEEIPATVERMQGDAREQKARGRGIANLSWRNSAHGQLAEAAESIGELPQCFARLTPMRTG
jgi:hypothetical protein